MILQNRRIIAIVKIYMMISMIIIEDMFVYLLSKRIRHSVIRNKVDIELKDPNMFKIKRVD